VTSRNPDSGPVWRLWAEVPPTADAVPPAVAVWIERVCDVFAEVVLIAGTRAVLWGGPQTAAETRAVALTARSRFAAEGLTAEGAALGIDLEAQDPGWKFADIVAAAARAQENTPDTWENVFIGYLLWLRQELYGMAAGTAVVQEV
jgi:hypothetical protein